MSSTKSYNTIIIGSGQGAYPLAKELANKQLKVAVIERDKLGGTCINWGCTPTKTLYASARVAHVVKKAHEYGIEVKDISINFPQVMERKNKVVDIWHDGITNNLEKDENIDVYYGEGSFINNRTVKIKQNNNEETKITADRIVINTGARARVQDIEGLEKIDYLDNKKILQLKTLPEHLVIIGGGYIALEFGQMFKRFGSEVTIIQRSGRLLSREDDDISDHVKKILEEEGIQVKVDSRVTKIRKNSDNDYTFTIETNGNNEDIHGTHLLMAIGRIPNSDSLNLQTAGIETESNGVIKINKYLETSTPGIYAIGDVKGGPAFTHISYDDYRILKELWFENSNRTINERSIPSTVFIDPQLGRIGFNEKQAKKQNLSYDLYKMNMSAIARAFEMGETKGILKVLVNPVYQTILGASILGFEGGELMNMIQIAIEAKMNINKLKNGVFAHPTLAEGFNNLFTYYKV